MNDPPSDAVIVQSPSCPDKMTPLPWCRRLACKRRAGEPPAPRLASDALLQRHELDHEADRGGGAVGLFDAIDLDLIALPRDQFGEVRAEDDAGGAAEAVVVDV